MESDNRVIVFVLQLGWYRDGITLLRTLCHCRGFGHKVPFIGIAFRLDYGLETALQTFLELARHRPHSSFTRSWFRHATALHCRQARPVFHRVPAAVRVLYLYLPEAVRIDGGPW